MSKLRKKDSSQPSHKARNFALGAIVLGAVGTWLVRAANVRARVQDIVERGQRPGGPLARQEPKSDTAANSVAPDDTTSAEPTPKQD